VYRIQKGGGITDPRKKTTTAEVGPSGETQEEKRDAFHLRHRRGEKIGGGRKSLRRGA